MQVQKIVMVEKEASEIGELLRDMLLAIKAKKPLATIAAEEFPALVKAVEGIDQLGAESKEDTLAFVNAFLLPVEEAAVAFLKPAPAADAAK